MEFNQPNVDGPRELPLPTPTTIDPGQAIVLNVLSPSSEVPGGRITFPRIHLDTKLSQLRTRIRNVLQAAPPPERQRLIYRGHALLDAEATLRQVLHPQGSTEPHSDTYTLHLVLPPGNVSGPPAPAAAQPIAHGQSPTGLPQPPMQPAVPNGLHNMPEIQLPQHVLAHAQASQMMLQNQLNLLQQQLAGQNHQHRQIQALAVPGMPGMNMMPNGMQITYQIHQNGQPGQHMPMPPGFAIGNPNAAALQAMMQQQQQMPHPALAGDQPTPTSGQPLANQPDIGMSDVHSRDNATITNNDEANGPDTSQQSPVTTRVQDTIGPQGQRIRSVVQETVNMTYTNRHGTPHPAVPQLSNVGSPNPFAADLPGMNVPRSSHSPASGAQAPQGRIHLTRHTQQPFMMPPLMSAMPANPSTTMGWVLSSPHGPEALLFSPDHGYFRSVPQLSPSRFAPRTTPGEEEGANLAAGGQDRVAPPQPDQAGAAQAIAHILNPNANPAAQVAEENEFLNFILGRGWLFLRMYVFTFFISQPNTWIRYALLAAATFICMLPRDNVLQRLVAQIRRHVDTLVGPPAAPPRAGAVDGAAAPGGVQAAANPAPAETAARLVREHEARNPNTIRDTLFRVERAAAMFLASLVPGMGERHVRAREDMRRESERLENERRAAEEAERVQSQAASEQAQIGDPEFGSSAVDTRDDTREVRERTAQAPGVETGA